MKLETVEILKKKLLDAQESVRDYQMYSKRMESGEVEETFKRFAEESALQARELQRLIDNYER